MARLPFPGPDAPQPDPQPATGRIAVPKPLTVSEASLLIRAALAEVIPAPVRIVGQISNFSNRTHWFFSLKDDGASLRCVCFASAVRAVRFPVRDGMEVIATGRIDYYDAQGQLQLYVDHLEPVGEGALELQFRALCAELRELGYFAAERKRPLPPFVQRLAVVTSKSGAALQDVLDTARRRWAGCEMLVMDVRVQGAGAAPQIAAALASLSQQGAKLGIDVILLTRGGGSIEDLWAFNERAVADAVFHCRLPVVAAIGHETDTTVAELVADVRCATPTQAAMTIVPDRQAMEHQVRQTAGRLTLLMNRQAQYAQQRLAAVARHRIFRQPLHLLEPLEQRLERARHRLVTALPARTERERARLEALRRNLEALGPRNVLSRGYSYTLDSRGQVLRDPQAVRQGERITSVLERGRLSSEVTGEGDFSPQPPPAAVVPPPKPAKPRARRSGDAGQATLFDGGQ
jgi:exodeoxyribonuclease VII large subunit